MKKSDCEVILDDIEGLGNSMGKCFDAIVDERKSFLHVIAGIFGLGSSLFKLSFNTTTCAIKQTPKAVVTVVSLKREVHDIIAKEYNTMKKNEKKRALKERIKMLKKHDLK